ncbi:hypothetical protein ACFX12_037476 [Malus domestica]
MVEINRLKSSKLKTTKSSSQESACLLLLRPPAASIPFQKISCFEAEEAETASAFAFRLGPPSLTGQPNREGSVVWEATCALCQRAISPENEATGDVEIMCGDCKFLYLEDLGSPSHDSYQMTPPTRRRARTGSSESLENNFSQQFSHMINLVQQNQSPGSGIEELPVGGDSATRIPLHTSNRTTPSGSRRWRRVLSDTESEGYENVDSFYGETKSNLSFGRYRLEAIELVRNSSTEPVGVDVELSEIREQPELLQQVPSNVAAASWMPVDCLLLLLVEQGSGLKENMPEPGFGLQRL